MISMIDYRMKINGWRLGKGITPENVEAHLKEVKEELKLIQKVRYDCERLGCDEEIIQHRIRALEHEVKMAEFYFRYKKKAKAPDFNKWVLRELQYEGWDRSEYKKNLIPTWVKTNGRITAKIRIEEGESSTRVSLSMENSDTLRFIEDGPNDGYGFNASNYKGKETAYSNLRKKESVDAKVAEYKEEAERIFKDCLFPRYCWEKEKYEEVKGLLHIPDSSRVRFLKDISAYKGLDGSMCGPFKVGEVVELPREEAAWMLKEGMGEEVV